MLEAEFSALKKKTPLAKKFFETAVLLAGQKHLIHLEALASERYAMYLEEIGETQDAKSRFNDAVILYEKWGATFKVDQLQANIAGKLN